MVEEGEDNTGSPEDFATVGQRGFGRPGRSLFSVVLVAVAGGLEQAMVNRQ